MLHNFWSLKRYFDKSSQWNLETRMPRKAYNFSFPISSFWWFNTVEFKFCWWEAPIYGQGSKLGCRQYKRQHIRHESSGVILILEDETRRATWEAAYSSQVKLSSSCSLGCQNLAIKLHHHISGGVFYKVSWSCWVLLGPSDMLFPIVMLNPVSSRMHARLVTSTGAWQHQWVTECCEVGQSSGAPGNIGHFVSTLDWPGIGLTASDDVRMKAMGGRG